MRAILQTKLLFVIVVFSITVMGQARVEQTVVPLRGGGFATFHVRVESMDSGRRSLTALNHRVETNDATGVLRRTLLDDLDNVIFAYELSIKLDPTTHQFSVVPLPVNESEATRNKGRTDIFTIPTATSSQVVRDGQTLALDLLVNDTMRIKVVDYLTVASERTLIEPEPSGPRDFGLADVELAMMDSTITLDNHPIISSSPKRSCRGSFIWLYVPGQGRFIFSLVSHPGYSFQKLAVIKDKTISFHWKGNTYEWTSSHPILGIEGSWNVWVLHDPNFVDLFAPIEDYPQSAKNSRPTFLEKPWSIRVLLDGPKDDKKSSHPPTAEPKPVSMRILIGGSQSLKLLIPDQ
jgi:hypothetical protein